MATVTVSLPKPLMDWVDSQTSAGEYADAGDYVRSLITRDQKRREQVLSVDDLRRLIADAKASGESEKTVGEIFEDARKTAQTRSAG